MRAHITVVNVITQFALNYGKEFGNATGSDTNFNFTAKLADWDCGLNISAECGYAVTATTADIEDLQKGAKHAQIQEVTLTVPVNVPAYMCNVTQFLCISVETGENAKYADPAIANNIHCQNVSTYVVCMPGRNIN